MFLGYGQTFKDYWFFNYGQQLIDCVIKQFSVRTVKKVMFYQLKCIKTIAMNYPEIAKTISD